MGEVTPQDQLADQWFVHACTLIQGAGMSPYGHVVEGERVPFRGFVKQRTQRVDSPTGQELVTDTTVVCPLDVVAEVGDQVELPDPFSGVWEIIARSAHDGAGLPLPSHQRLTLQAAG